MTEQEKAELYQDLIRHRSSIPDSQKLVADAGGDTPRNLSLFLKLHQAYRKHSEPLSLLIKDPARTPNQLKYIIGHYGNAFDYSSAVQDAILNHPKMNAKVLEYFLSHPGVTSNTVIKKTTQLPQYNPHIAVNAIRAATSNKNETKAAQIVAHSQQLNPNQIEGLLIEHNHLGELKKELLRHPNVPSDIIGSAVDYALDNYDFDNPHKDDLLALTESPAWKPTSEQVDRIFKIGNRNLTGSLAVNHANSIPADVLGHFVNNANENDRDWATDLDILEHIVRKRKPNLNEEWVGKAREKLRLRPSASFWLDKPPAPNSNETPPNSPPSVTHNETQIPVQDVFEEPRDSTDDTLHKYLAGEELADNEFELLKKIL